MRRVTLVAVPAVLALTAGVVLATLTPAAASTPSAAALVIGRQVLAPMDGWASATTGTTGGSAADDAHVFVVHDRDQLAAAVSGSTPKIVFINGGIDGNVDANDQPLTCADYADPAWNFDDFLATFDPAVWGRTTKPSGPLEDARVRSTKNQAARVNILVGSNTTIVGLHGSKITGANLVLNKVDNVIIRNIRMEDAFDCFPAWDPTDGATGNWNSNYDTLSLTGATHVWVDHSNFSDGNDTDNLEPLEFGRPLQKHDGLLDITKAADLVTVSYCTFFDHDKTMLIGSTNTVGADVGKLRVTLHHNKFANVGQRTPRVRFGQVDVYNNFFQATTEATYVYSWGVGVFASLYAENNMVLRSADIAPDQVVFDWRGGVAGGMTEIGSMTRIGTGPVTPISFLDAYNATHTPAIDGTDFVPTLRAAPVDPTDQVQSIVTKQAGAGKLGI
jgi:pectate lyase